MTYALNVNLATTVHYVTKRVHLAASEVLVIWRLVNVHMAVSLGGLAITVVYMVHLVKRVT